MATSDFVTKMRQFVCGVQGHDTFMEFGRGRLSLKCVSCGHETPGWDIKPYPTRVPAPTVAAREERRVPLFTGARRLHDAFPQM